jgi:hypothetical protein
MEWSSAVLLSDIHELTHGHKCGVSQCFLVDKGCYIANTMHALKWLNRNAPEALKF